MDSDDPEILDNMTQEKLINNIQHPLFLNDIIIFLTVESKKIKQPILVGGLKATPLKNMKVNWDD